MRVALVKQDIDLFGPWETISWPEGNELRLAERWPGKATYWELTCLLKADWYIIHHVFDNDYTRHAVHKHPGRRLAIQGAHRGAVHADEIRYQDYDVVISMDPVLRDPVSSCLFAYYCQEHWDSTYAPSLERPFSPYDLFLDHMLQAPSELTGMPQAVAFPYLRSPDTVRRLFPRVGEDAAWADWRTLTTLAMTDVWTVAADKAALRLSDILGVGVRYGGNIFRSSYGFQEEPSWGDFLLYYEGLAACKYYIAVGRASGAGQGAGEAASAGCIVLGERDKAYHRLLCHPECLCDNMLDLPHKFRRLGQSRELQEEVLDWQERRLRHLFVDGPTRTLLSGLRSKRLAKSAPAQTHAAASRN
jgi:hypothetical protein